MNKTELRREDWEDKGIKEHIKISEGSSEAKRQPERREYEEK